ncbi:MAG: TerB family tellurite resistance protein [Alcanivoracaceae bacterium]
MHFAIAAITALAGLIWALNSLQGSGVDLNSFNPFTWARRRRWAKLYGTRPLYNLSKPMEAAAAIIVGTLKQEGEISREQKASVIAIFRSHFHLNDQSAMDLFSASSHLVKDELNLGEGVRHILQPSIARFTPDMASSFVGILVDVANLEGPPSEAQRQIIERVRCELGTTARPASNWD